jgi:hypothetical protein
MSARLVMDFDPGTVTRAATGPAAAGVTQMPAVLLSCCAPPMLRAYWPAMLAGARRFGAGRSWL